MRNKTAHSFDARRYVEYPVKRFSFPHGLTINSRSIVQRCISVRDHDISTAMADVKPYAATVSMTPKQKEADLRVYESTFEKPSGPELRGDSTECP